ncbi:D-3-phosphoglycerate dehydrogenase [Planctomycetes bacterium Poly30]|uniref:2-oxoglutarate reductase n=1 Tax=Saltatorellus ferox TaxID=2528018 RepID=A0A518EYM5_9BACT|nr:D-3-phosphoglycerate dehydrogenase [Planctomycetes bacterium Poly30]
MLKTSFPRSEISVLLLEGIAPSAVDAFRDAGYERIDVRSGALTGGELIEAAREAHIIGIRSRTHLDAEVLKAARKLVAIGCFCIGTNQVDTAFARRRGVPVFNAPYSNTRSVAELVIAEAILLLRRIPEKHMACHRGDWIKSATGSHEARGKTIGIVGYGHIGTQVGVLAEMLGMRVLYHDIESKLSLGNVEASTGLNELLERADVVTLHVPATRETEGMMGAAEIARMRDGAVLINASRGNVVDLEALREALVSGRIAGAAVDVFPVEPEGNGARFESPLVGLDNALLTPHVGGSTEEAQNGIGREVAEKLLRYSDDGSTLSAVDFPEVTLPRLSSDTRLLHVHENRPGMLKAINETIGSSAANIDAQYLRTLDDVGYVVTDVAVEREAGLQLGEDLRKLPGTLRSRVLF